VKNPFDHLDKTLEHRVRLQIMSVLITNEAYDFNSLKEVLNVTDGNLASHIKALEKEKYISVNKTFVEKKPNTRYKITTTGRNAFNKHVDALEGVVKQQKG
jgi:DNA-binding MarR family transcriptional regulator